MRRTSYFLGIFCFSLVGVHVKLPSLKGVYPPFVKNIPHRGPSTPFISGDTFRWIADWKLDEFQEEFLTEDVQVGDIIFVHGDHLGYFFQEVYPHIEVPFILLTHNSDATIPGKYMHYLQDEKIIGWFGQNVGQTHPKLHPLPIGFANRYWPHGRPQILHQAMKEKAEKDIFAYLNITAANNLSARRPVVDYFKDKLYCTQINRRKSFFDYLLDLKRSMFTISPPGNGLDCHRTYEALLMGSFPVIKTSASDSMYDDLPVVIINDWSEVTQEFLYMQLAKFKGKKFNFKKLFSAYWIEKIRAIQIAARDFYSVG